MPDTAPEFRVVDNPADRRFELWTGEMLVGFADYRLADGVIRLPHVEIEPELQGRGYGGYLTKAVLDECRARGLRVEALCPFVVAYLEDHPEYDDIAVAG